MTISICSGTWLIESRKPLRDIIFFIYWWSYKKTSIKFYKHKLGFSESSTVDYSYFLWEVYASHLRQTLCKIGGLGNIFKIDENLFSHRKYHTGWLLPEQWIFGGILRNTNECFMYAIPDRIADTLISCIKECMY